MERRFVCVGCGKVCERRRSDQKCCRLCRRSWSARTGKLIKHRVSAKERFWRRVRRAGSDECWLWDYTRKRYGEFRVVGRGAVLAHRFAWELAHGAIPAGMEVMHTCDVTHCCNPRHLRLGTHLDNMHDASVKRRMARPRGELHGEAKLTWKGVRAMRRRYARGDVSQRSLAARFGVCQARVSLILRGLGWKEEVNANTKTAAI